MSVAGEGVFIPNLAAVKTSIEESAPRGGGTRERKVFQKKWLRRRRKKKKFGTVPPKREKGPPSLFQLGVLHYAQVEKEGRGALLPKKRMGVAQ